MNLTTTTFGRRLAKARKDKNLSQTELAEMVNLRQAAISGYEKNLHFPPLEKLCQIANTLNVSIDWLCGSELSTELLEQVQKYYESLEIGTHNEKETETEEGCKNEGEEC